MKLVIVTGASRGFGQALVLQMSESPLFLSAHFVLLARSVDNLTETVRTLVECKVSAFGLELEHAPHIVESRINEILATINFSLYSDVYLINNAGTLGPLMKIADLEIKDVTVALQVNVISLICLITNVMKRLVNDQRITVVNVSSLGALEPFDTWSIYCSGKSMRNMFHRCLAHEYPSSRVLNYAPGPLDTDMHIEARELTPETPLKHELLEMKARGTLVSASASSSKLIQILQTNTFLSGSHIDFYDA